MISWTLHSHTHKLDKKKRSAAHRTHIKIHQNDGIKFQQAHEKRHKNIFLSSLIATMHCNHKRINRNKQTIN